jgi:hypothetical protein
MYVVLTWKQEIILTGDKCQLVAPDFHEHREAQVRKQRVLSERLVRIG